MRAKMYSVFKKLIQPTFIYPILIRLRDYKDVSAWKLKGKPVPPPDFIKQQAVKEYARKFSIKILVETGTCVGTMVYATRNFFEQIFSIELSHNLCEEAKERFAKFSHIHIFEGDSSKVLSTILVSINQPCIFWLDAHYSGGITVLGERITPILEELKEIFAHPQKNHIILIDDARHFNGLDDFPTLAELKKFVLKNRHGWLFEINDDIIRLSPLTKS